jgi:hypothetical protein
MEYLNKQRTETRRRGNKWLKEKKWGGRDRKNSGRSEKKNEGKKKERKNGMPSKERKDTFDPVVA